MQHLRKVLHWTLAPGVAALALSILTGAAAAQATSEQQSAIRASCRSDFMSKCSGVTPGGKEALECLQKNVAGLSPACKTAVSAIMPAAPPAAKADAPAEPAAAATAAPAAPAPKPATKPAIVSAPPPPASARPPAAVVAAPKPPTAAQQNALKKYCRADVGAHCQGTSGKITLECLQRNVGALSPDCRKVVVTTMPKAAPGAVVVAPPVVVEPPPPKRLVAPATPLILKACARDIVLHCRGIEPGGGRIAACLNARIASGSFVGPRCRGAMKLSNALD